MHHFDILVIGSGLAGQSAALRLANTHKVGLISKRGLEDSASGWAQGNKLQFLSDLRTENYSYICPTSLDRAAKQWNTGLTAGNVDVTNIDSLLSHFNIRTDMGFMLVGHSNGGGFTSRFAILSSHSSQIQAIQVSNSSGLAQVLSDASYRFPTLFNFSTCDAFIDEATVQQNRTTLNSKQPPVMNAENDVTAAYAGGDPQCHEFINTSASSAQFFADSKSTDAVKRSNESDGIDPQGD